MEAPVSDTREERMEARFEERENERRRQFGPNDPNIDFEDDDDLEPAPFMAGDISDTDIEYDAWKDDRLDPQRNA